MRIPVVNTDQTCDFAEKWNWNGIYIAMTPAAIQFATDYANIVMASFIEASIAQTKRKQEEAEKAAQSKIILTGE